jgi:hypothetical protein
MPEPNGMYACGTCARDIEIGGVSDDEGALALTGRTGAFWALCDLCAAPATHELMYERVEK